MGSQGHGRRRQLAWPTAPIAVMGASGAVGFVYRQQLTEAAKKRRGRRRAAAGAAAGLRGHPRHPYIDRRRTRLCRRGGSRRRTPAATWPLPCGYWSARSPRFRRRSSGTCHCESRRSARPQHQGGQGRADRGGAGGGDSPCWPARRSAPAEPREAEQNLWGHPVDRLRYPTFSWQRVTLLQRTHMRK